MGKRRRHAKQASMWVATQDLRSVTHPFNARRDQILEQHGLTDTSKDCGCCARAASAWNARSPISMRRVGCVRVHLRGHTNIRKRLLIQASGFNLGLLTGS